MIKNERGTTMSNIEIEARHAYHQPKTEETAQLHEAVRDKTKELALWLDQNLPQSREKTMALTKVQEAMWAANAAVAIYQ